MPIPQISNIEQNIPLEEKYLQEKILEKINNIKLLGNFKSITHIPPTQNSTCLMLFIKCYKDKRLKLTEEEWTYLIKNSDLLYVDHNGQDALMCASVCNSSHRENLNLTAAQWDYLIKNSDLTRVYEGHNSLMYILLCHQEYKTKINKHTFDYLIDNSNLLQRDEVLLTSVLGIVIEINPTLANKVFTKVLSLPEFNINDYKSDLQYKEIRDKMIKIETNITKNNINKSMPIIPNKKSFKL